ncbi:hypothetical protein GC197_15960 [bacterium]|nr:hypothetical protein [bacterium]
MRTAMISSVGGWLLLLLVGFPAARLAAEDALFQTEVRLATPKKDSKRSREGGLGHVPFRIWLPGEVKTVRGLILNPMYTDAVTQQHWQAFARHWDFGILATNFFGAKSQEFPDLIDTALAKFAEESGHQELIGAKMCLVGMSAGAGNCVRIAELMPDRIIAVGPVCLEVSPRNEPSMKIPMMTVFGERDGTQGGKLHAKLPEVRAQGALFGIAVQWGRKHEFGQANNLLFPLFDVAIRQRLGKPGEPLRPYPESSGWLGDLSHWRDGEAVIESVSDFSGDKSTACWFPDAKTAHAWQAFVMPRDQKITLASPPGMGDKQPLIIHKAGSEIEIKVAGTPKTEGPIEVYSGGTKLGELKEGSLTVTMPDPGFYPLYLQASAPDGTILRSRPHTIILE